MGMPGRKAIGKNLQSIRKKAGFNSAKAFAEYIGMPVSAYTEYEQGRNGFTYEQAWEFADALGCTLDDLGGRGVPECRYSDPRQEALNGHYDSLNDESKTDLVKFAKSFAADSERRMEKSRPEHPAAEAAMGA